jgi:hypothetical protein
LEKRKTQGGKPKVAKESTNFLADLDDQEFDYVDVDHQN